MVDYDLSEAQLKKTCKKCIENAKGLLAGSAVLLSKKKTKQYALGLYIYAIEEFGKAYLLKSYFTGNKIKYQIPGWIFGRKPYPSGKTSHDVKLETGLQNLPQVCRHLTRVLEITIDNFFTSPQIITLKQDNLPDSKVAVMAGVTGIAEDVTNRPSREIKDYKKDCFYINWDLVNKTPTFIIPVDKYQLRHNIRRFKETLRKFAI